MKNLLFILGTRPEAIKLAPVILEARKNGIHCQVLSTGQHGEHVEQMLSLFGIEINVDLQILTYCEKELEVIFTRILEDLSYSYGVREFTTPDLCFVQGDTTSALVGALWAFYNKIPIAHIEAGLRSHYKYSPFPEEMHRRVITQLADYHFCPTGNTGKQLFKESIFGEIHIVGNTVIDALHLVLNSDYQFKTTALQELDFKNNAVIVMTLHRRENWGIAEEIFRAIDKFVKDFEDIKIVLPVHMNKVGEIAKKVFSHNKNVILVDPLPYDEFINLLARSIFIVTDSGGIQEEAPSLRKPVLVIRRETERTEGIADGVSSLIGINPATIRNKMKDLLFNEVAYYNMVDANYGKYGYGDSAQKIIRLLKGGNHYGDNL